MCLRKSNSVSNFDFKKNAIFEFRIQKYTGNLWALTHCIRGIRKGESAVTDPADSRARQVFWGVSIMHSFKALEGEKNLGYERSESKWYTWGHMCRSVHPMLPMDVLEISIIRRFLEFTARGLKYSKATALLLKGQMWQVLLGDPFICTSRENDSFWAIQCPASIKTHENITENHKHIIN